MGNIRKAYLQTLEPDANSSLPSLEALLKTYEYATDDGCLFYDVSVAAPLDPVVHSTLVSTDRDPPDAMEQIASLRYYTRKMFRIVLHHTLVLISYCDEDMRVPPKYDEYVDDACGVDFFTAMFCTVMFSFAQVGIVLGDVVAQNITSPLTQDYLDSSHNREKACKDLMRNVKDGDLKPDEREGDCENAIQVFRQRAAGRSRLQVDALDQGKQIVYTLFNGKRVKNGDFNPVYFRLANEVAVDFSGCDVVVEKLLDCALLTEDEQLVFVIPQEYFTNNLCPQFTRWVLKNLDYIDPLDHMSSLFVLCRTNRRIYSHLYKSLKNVLDADSNKDNVLLAYIRLYINMLTRDPNKIASLNRSYIGKSRDRLSAACFENPKKVLVKSALCEERKRGWTSTNFAFGLDISHVGVLQNTSKVVVVEEKEDDFEFYDPKSP